LLANRLRRIAAAALIALPAQAQVHEYTLVNGLRLFVKQDQRAPIVVSQVWYGVGSSYEHDGITGISHALEHMMFKGTARYPAGEFSRIISANGGRENAFTGADYSAYFQELERSRLPVSFELEADRMRNLTLPPGEFAKEIEVVKEERRMRVEDDPESYTYEVALAVAYQTSPYRHPIIGWMQDLERMTVEDLRRWYARWYAPNNASVVVVGDVDPDEVHALARQYFGSLPAGDPVRPVVRREVEQHGIKRVIVRRPAELPYLLLAYKVPVLRTALTSTDVPDWEPYALEVLTAVLDGNSSARLASRVVRGQQVASDAGASYNLSARLDSLLILDGTPAQGRSVAELEAALREEIELLRNELVTPDELERIKTQVVVENVYQRDSPFYQAMLIGLLETVGLSWRMIDEYVEWVRGITAEQVQAVARKYLHDDGLTVATLEPLPINSKTSRAAPGDLEHGH
jgi:zinc protease